MPNLLPRGIRRLLPLAGCLILALAPFSVARAATIPAGAYYLHATDGFYPFPPPIGTVEFHGRPFGLGDADTIYRILSDVSLDTLNVAVTVPLEVVRLDVESFAPVNIGGTFFNLFIHLTPGTHSLGELTVTQQTPDDGGPGQDGFFHQNVTLQFTAEFTPVGGGPGAFTLSNSVFIQTVVPAPFSFNPLPNFVQVNSGPPELQTTQFFVLGDKSIFMLDPTAAAGGHKHEAVFFAVFPVPEPSTVPLLATGLAALAVLRRLRASNAA